jgi:hypothetical protein
LKNIKARSARWGGVALWGVAGLFLTPFLFPTIVASDTELPFPGGDTPPVTTSIPFLVELGGTYSTGSDWDLGECLIVGSAVRDGVTVKKVNSGPCAAGTLPTECSLSPCSLHFNTTMGGTKICLKDGTNCPVPSPLPFPTPIEGAYIDVSGSMISVDPTEINTVTFGNNTSAQIIWTLDPSGSINPQIGFANGAISFDPLGTSSIFFPSPVWFQDSVGNGVVFHPESATFEATNAGIVRANDVVCSGCVGFGDLSAGVIPSPAPTSTPWDCGNGKYVQGVGATPICKPAPTPGGGGSSISLDLDNDTVIESVGIKKIATSGDTNSIAVMPSADVLMFDMSQDWPKCDMADDLDCSGCVSDADLADVISPASCTNCNLTYDADGRIIAAANGSGGGAAFDPALINDTTWGNNTDSAISWTFNSSGNDSILIAKNTGFTLSTTGTGALVLDDKSVADGASPDGWFNINCISGPACQFDMKHSITGGAPNSIISSSNSGALSIGDSLTSQITLTTNSTGDGEVILPANSIGSAEMVSTISAGSCTSCNLSYDAAGRILVAGNGVVGATITAATGTPTPTITPLPIATQTPWDCGTGKYAQGMNQTPICKVAPTPDGVGVVPQEAAAALWFLGNTAANTTPLYYHAREVSSIAYQEQSLPFAAELSRLYVQCPTAVASGSQTFTTVIDGVADSTLQCAISGGVNNCSDTTGTISVTPTTRITVQSVGAVGATAPAFCAIALRVRASGGGVYDSIVSFGGYNNGQPNSGTFCAPCSALGACNSCTQASEASAQWIAPSAGTLSGIQVRLDTGLFSGTTETYTVKNSTTGILTGLAVAIGPSTLVGGSTNCTHDCSFSAGDQLTIAFTRTAGNDLRGRNIVVTMHNTGQIVTTQNVGNTLLATAYTGPHQSLIDSAASNAWPAPNGGILKNLRASLPSTVANSMTFKICSAAAGSTPNCSGTRPSCTIAAGSLSCSDVVNTTTIAAGDVFNIQMTVGGNNGTVAAAVSMEIAGSSAFDPTTINDVTWGNNTDSAMTWGFNVSGANDPNLVAKNNTLSLETTGAPVFSFNDLDIADGANVDAAYYTNCAAGPACQSVMTHEINSGVQSNFLVADTNGIVYLGDSTLVMPSDDKVILPNNSIGTNELTTTGVAAGTYANATVTVGVDGRVTAMAGGPTTYSRVHYIDATGKTNNTTLSDDAGPGITLTGFPVTLGGGIVYKITGDLLVIGSTAGGFKLGLQGPAATTVCFYTVTNLSSETATPNHGLGNGCSTSPIAVAVGLSGNANGDVIHISGVLYLSSGSSGTVDLQWAQNTANGTTTTLLSGSWMTFEMVREPDVGPFQQPAPAPETAAQVEQKGKKK